MTKIKVCKIDKREIFFIEVDEVNYKFRRELLNKEKRKIIDRLKNYKNAGLIGSIHYPRNKTIQDEIDELVRKKRLLTNSIKQINEIYK